jgi:lipid-A-disaccharide synthase
MKVGIVAGELSGDVLGAGLIRALRHHVPELTVSGLGGPAMISEGCDSLFNLSELSVMGLIEVLKHYPRLRRRLHQLRDHFLADPPDVFIGIDSPDFNLRLEQPLKAAGIPVVHYVSPTVWAWREQRLQTIRRACDLMLTLFPFEADYYHRHHLPVRFVGHPLADEIPFSSETEFARLQLGLTPERPVIALLPGSRGSEVRQLAPRFLATAHWLLQRDPSLQFVLPAATPALKIVLETEWLNRYPELPLSLLTGQAHRAMAAADVVLLASGTASLEAMLLKKPMVVAYRLNPITHWLARRLVHIEWFSLPNLLAQQALVPEFLQNNVNPETLGPALLHWLESPNEVQALQQQFLQLHQQLQQSASEQAAQAVLALSPISVTAA